MAVIAGLIDTKAQVKANNDTKLAEAVAGIFSKNKVLKDLDIDYVGANPVSETHGIYEVELAGAIDADDDKLVNAVKVAITKELRASADKLAQAFEKAYGFPVSVHFGWASVEYADDPDGSDAVHFTVEFKPTSVQASRRVKTQARIKADDLSYVTEDWIDEQLEDVNKYFSRVESTIRDVRRLADKNARGLRKALDKGDRAMIKELSRRLYFNAYLAYELDDILDNGDGAAQGGDRN